MDFKFWKSLSPVQQMATRLGCTQSLSQSDNWPEYKSSMMRADANGEIVAAANRIFGKLSSGERPILAAMLHAADFSAIADRLTGDSTWTSISNASGEYSLAIALAIARR